MTDLEQELMQAQQEQESADTVETEQPEIKTSQEDTIEVVEEKASEPEYSEIELKAMERGWVPKDRYKGPEEDWVSAEVFEARGPLMAHINKLNQKLDDQGKTFQDFLKKTEKAAYEKAKKELMAERQKAFEEQNLQKFNELDEELLKLNDTKPDDEALASEAVQQFKQTQTWFAQPKNPQEKAMQAFAMQASSEFANQIGGDVNQELEFVMEQVKEAFPKYFEAPAKKINRGPDVVPAQHVKTSKPNTKLPDPRWNNLTEGQKAAAMQLKDYGVPVKQYIDTLQESGEL